MLSRQSAGLGFLVLVYLAGAAAPSAAATYKEKILYKFQAGGDGLGPYGGLVEDGAHNLYGTTLFGGGGCDCGIVFKIAPDGTETVLHTFGTGTDGAYPYYGTLLLDGQGNLYGTAEGGGSSGHGIVYELAPDGTETVLYNFSGGSDGSSPVGGLIVDKGGNFYGTTCCGGANRKGNVFMLAPNGTETSLYSFCAQQNCIDGATPDSTLTRDKSDNLYGTAVLGGATGKGVAFGLAPDGTETVLYSFCAQANCADGASPYSQLAMNKSGYLVGVTPYGGLTSCSGGCGVGFVIAPGGGEVQAYDFCSQPNCADGELPHEGPILASDGNVYGTATSGGANGYGDVYKVTPGGKLTVLYSFKGGGGGPDGAAPFGGVIVDKKGHIFGTTVDGGNGYGTVFELTK